MSNGLAMQEYEMVLFMSSLKVNVDPLHSSITTEEQFYYETMSAPSGTQSSSVQSGHFSHQDFRIPFLVRHVDLDF
jgi:hypothetical protein